MKKIVLGLLLISTISFGGSKFFATNKVSIIEERMEKRTKMIEQKLAIIQEKVGTEIKNVVAKKIKEKKEKIAIEQKKKVEEHTKQTAEQQDHESASYPQVTYDESINNGEVEVTSGASQYGREIGETNRAYGQQLSNPDLTQGERRAIIEEKKAYNRGRH